jgi:hypothetical protein
LSSAAINPSSGGLWRSSTRLLIAVFALALPFAATAAPTSDKESWDHVANIKETATRLVQLHKAQGSAGVLKFLDACYKTHLLADKFTQGLESCLAEDYMHTQVLTLVYARIPLAERQRLGTPSPEGIAGAMAERFTNAYAQYKKTDKDQEAFKKLVDKVGMPIFVNGIFPKKPDAPTKGP